MRRGNKKFHFKNAQHIYQRAVDKGVVFYTDEDRIVFYTLAAVKARKHGIIVTAGSIMFTHTHQSVYSHSKRRLDNYLHDLGTSFARLYNHNYSRKGQLIENPPGRSEKYSDKDKRTNIIYVYNNHVEKGLCEHAVNYRWSFLPYAVSPNPFSEKIDPATASKTLKRYLNLVDRRIIAGKALEYRDLNKILPSLNPIEREQFIDYVITNYEWIDFKMAAAHFDSLDSMLLAIDSTTGSENSIKEDHAKEKDIPYLELIKLAESHGFLKKIYKLDNDQKIELAQMCYQKTSAQKVHLKKFFHILTCR